MMDGHEAEPSPPCRCPEGMRFHALNCDVRPGEYQRAYVEGLERQVEALRRTRDWTEKIHAKQLEEAKREVESERRLRRSCERELAKATETLVGGMP